MSSSENAYDVTVELKLVLVTKATNTVEIAEAFARRIASVVPPAQFKTILRKTSSDSAAIHQEETGAPLESNQFNLIAVWFAIQFRQRIVNCAEGEPKIQIDVC